MRKRFRQFAGIVMACAMLQTFFTVPAAETEAAGTLAAPEGQLTLEEIDAMNGGAGHVYLHDDRVTMVDGTCTKDLVTGMDDAEAVVNSMITLIGGDADTQFVPWRQVMDPLGNVYYIFQQMYHDTTVCGGAVKVVTDADCNMIGLSSSTLAVLVSLLVIGCGLFGLGLFSLFGGLFVLLLFGSLVFKIH